MLPFLKKKSEIIEAGNTHPHVKYHDIKNRKYRVFHPDMSVPVSAE
jgi:hypothetical protein